MHRPIHPSGIPALIKRNIALFALSQSFTGAGMQLAYGIGPLMVIALTGSASLAGLTVGLFGISRFLVSYAVGKITDRYGRKPGILLGLALAMAGTITAGIAMIAYSIVALVVGMLIFGMGMNASQQMRVAATDMFPPRLRGRALGYVALGSMLGIGLSPLIMGASEMIAHHTGYNALGVPWLIMPLLIASGMVLVVYVRPDPKQIGMQLERYYPDYTPRHHRRLGTSPTSAPGTCSASCRRGSPSFRTAPARATWRS
jgi:MFS family permease